MSALQGILHQVCPRCRSGAIFHRFTLRRWLSMNEHCPVCHMKFNREQGYFLGAMYFSYGLSIPPVLGLVLLFWRGLHWPFQMALLAACIAYLPLVPMVVRFSRVLWIYFDRSIDPN